MLNGYNTNTRRFTTDNPILYNGQYYPSTTMPVDDGTGNIQDMTVFADRSGNYFNQSGTPVMLQDTLPEVVVHPTQPTQEEMAANMFNSYLTMSNDRTKVSNVPHRQYNTHLNDRTIQGAKSNALWEKEHPNLDAWGKTLAAIPFAVAAAPAAMAGGDALAGSSLGQAATRGLGILANAAKNSTFLPWADAAVTSGFGAKGMQDVGNGTFTPETAIDLMPLMQLAKVQQGIKTINKVSDAPSISDNIFNKIKHDYPLKGETEIPTDIKAEAANKYTDFINSENYLNRLRRAGLEDHWEYMKDLTDRRINNIDYFPGKVKTEINNDPDISGLSAVEPSSENYGITLQEDLPNEEVFPTLYHEIAHWATGNAGVNDVVNSVRHPFKYDSNVKNIGDIMRYNESIAPVKEWEDILNALPKDMPINKIMEIQKTYNYLIRPQEIRARLYNIYQQAKDSGMSLDAFIDKFTRNGRITSDAPMNLRQLGDIFTIDNLKKRLSKFLGISAPTGIGVTTLNNQQNGQDTSRR